MRARKPTIVSSREKSHVNKEFILTLCYDETVLSRLYGPTIATRLTISASSTLDEHLYESHLRGRDGNNFYFETTELAIESAVKLANSISEDIVNGKYSLVRTILLCKQTDVAIRDDLPYLVDYFSTLSGDVAIVATDAFDSTLSARFDFRLSTGEVVTAANLIYKEEYTKSMMMAKKMLYQDNHILFHCTSKKINDILPILKDVGINAGVVGNTSTFVTSDYSILYDLILRLLPVTDTLCVADGYDISFSTDTKEFSGRTYKKVMIMAEKKLKGVFSPSVETELKSGDGEKVDTHILKVDNRIPHDVLYYIGEVEQEQEEVHAAAVSDGDQVAGDSDLLNEIGLLLDRKLTLLAERLEAK